MRLSLLSAIVAGALSLAACGQSGPAETARNAEYEKAIALMPDFAPLFPDSQVQSSIGTGTGPNPVGTVSFYTKATADEVIAFYRGKAEAAGMEETTDDVADVGTSVFTALRGDMMGMKVIASPGEGATNVQVVWSRQVQDEE